MAWLGPIFSFVIICSHFLPLHSLSTFRQRDVAAFRADPLLQTSGRYQQGTPQREIPSIFRAIWEVPNFCKNKFDIKIPLSEFGIEFNKDHQWRRGDVLNEFNQDFGRYPYVNYTTGEFINGGIPQLGNITEHLEKAADEVRRQIRDPDYQGLAMIDWEAWFPQWDFNNEPYYQRYKTYSKDYVRSRYPDWDNATIETVAKLEWTQGAKLFMESTIKVAKYLRPKALWGYYHYPYCKVNGSSPKCEPYQPKLNDEIMWLFNESRIILPSIYLRPYKNVDFKSSVEGELAEAFRIREKSNHPRGHVMSYIRFNYTSTEFYLSLQDLNHTILTSAEFGTHGVIIWGDHHDDETAQICHELKDYVINALGPTVVMAREGAESCKMRVCSGRGRCVGKILTCGKGDYGKNKKERKRDEKISVCSCRCFVGWQGYDCSIETK